MRTELVTKKIICGYFIELWYTYRVWELDFPKPAVLEIVNLTFFQCMCWKTLLQSINQNRFMIENTCSEKHFLVYLQNKYIPHKMISPKWKRYFRKKKSNIHSKKVFTFAFFHYCFSLSFDILVMAHNLTAYRLRDYTINKWKKIIVCPKYCKNEEFWSLAG